MSILQFPKILQVHVLGTGEKLDLGGFQPAVNGELEHVTLFLHATGTVPGIAQLFLGLHLSTDFSVSFATSTAFFATTIGSAISGTPTGDWNAVTRFDFGRPNLNKNQEYRLSLQSIDYTRVGDTFFIGAARDFPFPIYELAVPKTFGAEYPAYKSVLAFVEPT